MKHFYLTASLSLLLLACDGTEVGNGATTGDDRVSTEAKSGAAPTPDSASAPKTATESSTNVPASAASSLEPYMFAACASPLAEASAAQWVTADGLHKLTMTAVGKSLLVVSDSRQAQITPQPEQTKPYAISVEPVVGSFSCGPVQTSTLADGRVRRELLIDASILVQWELTGGLLSRITVQNPMASLFVEWVRIP